jgi:hypothetical protein
LTHLLSEAGTSNDVKVLFIDGAAGRFHAKNIRQRLKLGFETISQSAIERLLLALPSIM